MLQIVLLLDEYDNQSRRTPPPFQPVPTSYWARAKGRVSKAKDVIQQKFAEGARRMINSWNPWSETPAQPEVKTEVKINPEDSGQLIQRAETNIKNISIHLSNSTGDIQSYVQSLGSPDSFRALEISIPAFQDAIKQGGITLKEMHAMQTKDPTNEDLKAKKDKLDAHMKTCNKAFIEAVTDQLLPFLVDKISRYVNNTREKQANEKDVKDAIDKMKTHLDTLKPSGTHVDDLEVASNSRIQVEAWIQFVDQLRTSWISLALRGKRIRMECNAIMKWFPDQKLALDGEMRRMDSLAVIQGYEKRLSESADQLEAHMLKLKTFEDDVYARMRAEQKQQQEQKRQQQQEQKRQQEQEQKRQQEQEVKRVNIQELADKLTEQRKVEVLKDQKQLFDKINQLMAAVSDYYKKAQDAVQTLRDERENLGQFKNIQQTQQAVTAASDAFLEYSKRIKDMWAGYREMRTVFNMLKQPPATQDERFFAQGYQNLQDQFPKIDRKSSGLYASLVEVANEYLQFLSFVMNVQFNKAHEEVLVCKAIRERVIPDISAAMDPRDGGSWQDKMQYANEQIIRARVEVQKRRKATESNQRLADFIMNLLKSMVNGLQEDETKQKFLSGINDIDKINKKITESLEALQVVDQRLRSFHLEVRRSMRPRMNDADQDTDADADADDAAEVDTAVETSLLEFHPTHLMIESLSPGATRLSLLEDKKGEPLRITADSPQEMILEPLGFPPITRQNLSRFPFDDWRNAKSKRKFVYILLSTYPRHKLTKQRKDFYDLFVARDSPAPVDVITMADPYLIPERKALKNRDQQTLELYTFTQWKEKHPERDAKNARDVVIVNPKPAFYEQVKFVREWYQNNNVVILCKTREEYDRLTSYRGDEDES